MPHPLVTPYDMVDVPLLIPVITPLVFTVPTAVLLLLHAPPPVPLLLKVVVLPTHTVFVPLSVPGTGNGLTVTIAVA